MNFEAAELHTRLVQVREREAELQRKSEETRDLLSKADARRARDRDQVGRWNLILDNLERSYDAVRRELERTRIAREELERELSRALDSTGETLSAIDADPDLAAEAAARATVNAVVSDDDDAFGYEYTPPDEGCQIGWRDLLRMSMEDLALLTEEEIMEVRRNLERGLQARLGETDRRLIEARLQLAAQLRESAAMASPENEEHLQRRRQIILRAAVDKIQHNRVGEMTEEEVRAVQLCQQRLASKPEASPGEKRLLRVIEAALALLRRQKRRGL
ncbi:MAG: hypothetical protein RLZZ303_1862 [Candidatus Hydrogenedentota bacterium]|jgi:hypothetical protein